MERLSIAKLRLPDISTESGAIYPQMDLSYQLFGAEWGSAPVVFVIHALTGNSNVAGENGWWKSIVGPGKGIDTDHFSVLAFNIPGNGFGNDGIEEYKDFNARDVAKIFALALEKLGVDHLFAALGGSLGGGIIWELAVLKPQMIEHLIPVATDWRSSDWLIATTYVQESILLHSQNPVANARRHAMLCYRSPESLNERFSRQKDSDGNGFEVEAWLEYHGKSLSERFSKTSYLLMNHLLGTIDITRARGSFQEVTQAIVGDIHLVSVDSDLLFPHADTQATYRALRDFKSNVYHHTLQSKHGHDAFLIEHEQLHAILSPLFHSHLISLS